MVGIADHARNEGSDDFGEADDSETDEGVHDDLFGFLEFVGLSGGGGVRDATVDYEDKRDYAGDTDEPLDGAGDECIGVDAFIGNTVGEGFVATEEDDADGAHD